MTRLWAIIWREFTENARQPWLVVTLATVLVAIGGASLWLLSFADGYATNPGDVERILHWTTVAGMPIEDPFHQMGSTTVVMLEALIFTQLTSMTAVLAGHAGLHDRQVGTLPFLLLAPVGRVEVLTGKVLGALGVPLLIYFLVGGGVSYLAATHPSAESVGAFLPPSPGWYVAFCLGAPAWSVVIGTICVLVSAVARDVRTAQQAAWAVVFFATFVLSPLLVGLMSTGPLVQAVIALMGVVLAGAMLLVGSWVIGRDLTR